MKLRYIAPAVLATTVTLGSAPALADLDWADAEKLRADGTVLPTAKVAEIATTARPGVVAELELERVLGRYVYEVEVRDPEGREWDLDIDARSGEVLQSGQDD